MRVPELSFLLEVNCQFYNDGFFHFMRELATEIGVTWPYKYRYTGLTDDNWITFGRNQAYDPDKVDVSFYYPYVVEVMTRKNPDPTHDDYMRQVEFARKLVNGLREHGCDVSVQGEIEADL